jgi:hypothetical protein
MLRLKLDCSGSEAMAKLVSTGSAAVLIMNVQLKYA